MSRALRIAILEAAIRQEQELRRTSAHLCVPGYTDAEVGQEIKRMDEEGLVEGNVVTLYDHGGYIPSGSVAAVHSSGRAWLRNNRGWGRPLGWLRSWAVPPLVTLVLGVLVIVIAAYVLWLLGLGP